jgi:large subunit ribosomal protein L17
VTPLVNQLVTLGKQTDSVDAHRRAFSYLGDHDLVKRLFVDIAPMFVERNGGYTRIIPFKRRRGDNAEMVILELTAQKTVAHPEKDKKQEALKKERAEHVRTQLKEEKKPAAEPVHGHGASPVKEAPKKEPKKPVKKGLGIGKIFKAGKESK